MQERVEISIEIAIERLKKSVDDFEKYYRAHDKWSPLMTADDWYQDFVEYLYDKERMNDLR